MKIVSVTRKPFQGALIDLVLEQHTGALNILSCCLPVLSCPDVPGRWPPNVFLVHKSGCKTQGTRLVKTNIALRTKTSGKNIFSTKEKPPLPDLGYADENGNETIVNWDCEPGCVICDLDLQSGMLKNGGSGMKGEAGSDAKGNTSAVYGKESRPKGTLIPGFGDRGGFSRYFPQFQK